MTHYLKLSNKLVLFCVFTFTTLASGQSLASAYNIQNSIVKITATHNHPNYGFPWQRSGIHSVTGSGVIISENRILTNAHVVADHTLVKVQREGSGNTFIAEVAFIYHSYDLALLKVVDNDFFKHAEPLEIDGLPSLRSRVSVYGFPTGGETISITEGIVSRIEVDFYVHSSERYLLVQVDAAINPGNSGGPVISDGKIVGIAMQSLEHAENIGYIVPSPIIDHFLKDVEDGELNGFAELDVYVQLIENKDLRKSMDLPLNSGGMLITGVSRGTPVDKLLKPGDVLLEIDGYAIGQDGKVTLDNGLRVESTHLEYLKQIGEKLSVTILRNNKKLTVNIPLKTRKPRINSKEYDKTPTYYVFAGLVFQPISSGYLEANQAMQPSLLSYVPEYTLQGYSKQIPDRIQSKRKQVVVLSHILPDIINDGYKDMEGSVIYSINNTPVEDLKHLIEIIKNAKGTYLKIVTDFGNQIIMDKEKAKNRHKKILQQYQIFDDRSPDLR